MDGTKRISFIERRSELIKQLPGFQKHFRVPTSAGASDQKFIATLTEPILDSDLQETFSALRKSFGLKRKEISVDGPFEGSGSVATPFFRYEIQAQIDEEVPSRVVFSRSVSDISEFARVVAGPFDEVFGQRFSTLIVDVKAELDLESIVDAIEDDEPEGVSIDYDKDLTWCEIQLLGSTATIVVEPTAIRVQSVRDTTPRHLLKLFTEFQQQFIDKLDWSGVPLD
jgi:hypothetical protein